MMQQGSGVIARPKSIVPFFRSLRVSWFWKTLNIVFAMVYLVVLFAMVYSEGFPCAPTLFPSSIFFFVVAVGNGIGKYLWSVFVMIQKNKHGKKLMLTGEWDFSFLFYIICMGINMGFQFTIGINIFIYILTQRFISF
jgi:hypothetical protein